MYLLGLGFTDLQCDWFCIGGLKSVAKRSFLDKGRGLFLPVVRRINVDRSLGIMLS